MDWWEYQTKKLQPPPKAAEPETTSEMIEVESEVDASDSMVLRIRRAVLEKWRR